MKRVLSFIFLAIITYSCSLNSPELPSWVSEWSIHLPLKDYTMSEAVDDSIIFADTINNSLRLEMSDTTDRYEIKRSDLGIGDSTSHFNRTLGSFKLDDESIDLDHISIWKVLDSTLIVDNKVLPYPDSDTQLPTQRGRFSSFVRILDIKNGKISLTFHNETFITIRSGMQISIYNDTINTNLLGTVIFSDSIPQRSSLESNRMDLDGKIIYKKLRLECTMPIKGSSTSHTLSEEDKKGYFYNTVNIMGLNVNSADAKIPVVNKIYKDSVLIDKAKGQIRRATIEDGKITFKVTNHLPVTANITLTLPDMKKNGQAFSTDFRMKANTSSDKTIDVDGYKLENHLIPGSFIEYFYYESVSTTEATDHYVLLNSQDSVVVDVLRDSLIFSRFEGKIDTVDFDFDPVETDGIDLGDKLEGEIRFNKLKMILDFHNELNLPIFINMSITGYKSGHEEDSVRVEINDMRVEPSGTQPITTIVLDKDSQSPSIVDLISKLPDKIIVKGNGYTFGEGSVKIHDGVQIIYRVESPLTILFSDTLRSKLDMETITEDDIDESMREKLTENLMDVTLKVVYTNGLPLGVNASVVLSTDSTDTNTVIIDSTKKIVLDEIIRAGDTNQDGLVDDPAEEMITIPLSKTQLEIFNNLPIYIHQKYSIPSVNKDVSFRLDDKIKADGEIRFKLKIGTK